jgi:hypothetical protein
MGLRGKRKRPGSWRRLVEAAEAGVSPERTSIRVGPGQEIDAETRERMERQGWTLVRQCHVGWYAADAGTDYHFERSAAPPTPPVRRIKPV